MIMINNDILYLIEKDIDLLVFNTTRYDRRVYISFVYNSRRIKLISLKNEGVTWHMDIQPLRRRDSDVSRMM